MRMEITKKDKDIMKLMFKAFSTVAAIGLMVLGAAQKNMTMMFIGINYAIFVEINQRIDELEQKRLRK